MARDYPNFNEVALNNQEHYNGLIDQLSKEERSIPTFVKDKDGNLGIISSHAKSKTIKEGDVLVYLGKSIIKPTETAPEQV